MALYGPVIPTAILLTPEGRREVHPASERWWEKIVELRYASQADRLRCPECDLRVVYVCEGVPTPYFKHYRDEQDCMGAGEDAGRQESRARAWLRHHLVVAFRRALPAGTRLECDAYLGNRCSWLKVALPAGPALLLNVVSQPLDLGEWSKRKAEMAVLGLPMLHMFVGRRVPGAVLAAPCGVTEVSLAGGLNADHLDAARSHLADIAHAVQRDFYGLRALESEPRTLLFFEPGETRDEPAALAILRGLTPNPSETVWHGALVKVPMVAGSLRFGVRHGLYAQADIEAVVCSRAWWRRYRKQRPHGAAPGPAVRQVHPLRLGWELKRQELRAELDEEHAAYDRVLAVLKSDGDRLLQGEVLPVVEPGLYAGRRYDWQTALLGFVWRAGVPFTLADAVAWVRTQGFVSEQNEYLEWENMRTVLAALVDLGLIRRQGDGSLAPVERFEWPVHGASHPGVPEPAVCLVCATVKRDTTRKPRWRVFDPSAGLCKCGTCRHIY